MAKIAFVFSGQGDQYPGMGRDFAELCPAAAKVYERCDRLRPGTSDQCFSGTEEELRETINTQPCLFATEMAMAAALLDRGLRPDAVAGFSLGELSAAVAAGIFSLETGFSLVCRRGALMQEAAEKADTAMAAVLRLSSEQVVELCGKFSQIYPVNFNCPGQVTVSGAAVDFPAFTAAVREAGGRALPLKVKGAFHSPFMDEAASAFGEELKKAELHRPELPIYSDLTAEPYTEDVAGLLSRQICGSVQWEKLILNMLASGVDTFIEIGPGQTLINMIRKIDPTVRAITVKGYLEEEENADR